MKPLYDRKGKTVGWLGEDRITGLRGEAELFVRNDRVFAYRTGNHVGEFEDGFLFDTAGRAVAFVKGVSGGPLQPLPE